MEFMEGILKVTPEKLTQASGEFRQSGQTISQLTSEMIGIVDGLKNVWQGEAATGFINKFDELKDDIERINSMIREHVKDLEEMAAEYKQAEQESLEQAQMLATEVVS